MPDGSPVFINYHDLEDKLGLITPKLESYIAGSPIDVVDILVALTLPNELSQVQSLALSLLFSDTLFSDTLFSDNLFSDNLFSDNRFSSRVPATRIASFLFYYTPHWRLAFSWKRV